MAEVFVCAMRNTGGPMVPSEHRAWLSERDWPGGGKVKTLKLLFGDLTVEVWPADKEHIEELSRKLAALARVLTEEAVAK